MMDETLYFVLYPMVWCALPIYFVLTRKEARNKRNVKWCITLFILILIGLEVIEAFTIKPSRISGNGNLGILGIGSIIPYFLGFHLMFGWLFGMWIGNLSRKKRGWLLGVTALFLVLFIMLSLENAQRIYEELSKYHEPIVYRGLNQYTNTVFINLYTFLTTIFLNMIVVQLLEGNRTKE